MRPGWGKRLGRVLEWASWDWNHSHTLTHCVTVTSLIIIVFDQEQANDPLFFGL